MTSNESPQIGIEDTDLKEINSGLAKVLADTFTLYLKTHGYHWNVTGPHFRSLHLMFEEQYNALFAASDDLAERMRALGDTAPGSMAEMLELSSLKDHEPTDDALEMVRILQRDHESIAATIRPLSVAADEAGDGATADLYNARLDFHEESAWMLRAFAS
ncbi:Dps family protein [Demequina activiva]|uniref:DNA starvation/stationary phase protection protein n=1 Tax=Demequina activiva TaxID=1582364 RepID=A0A919UF85_9MICO|nr:Dps family protein [Demequina activiva]GIG53397.1 DNA starvation/stationary phase protection protein [Demequina activiva]